MSPAETSASEFPKLRVTFAPEDDTRFLSREDTVAEYFDVQFYPFQPLDQDPVFAALSMKHVLIVRISNTADDNTNPCTIIRVIRDDDDSARNYTCTWSKDKVTGRPLLCVAGEDAKIKVYDVIDGRVVGVLVGHGGDINDMVTSPLDPLCIATASDDTTVRIWSLDPVHEKQPCLCILGGEGHQWKVLTIDWHAKGRYILSSGHDQVVNLWTLPDLPNTPLRQPLQVHYPHFSTSEIHSSLIDCIAFYGDFIISRACHDNIIFLWRIEGFSSKDKPPSPESAPTTINPTLLTRSSFKRATSAIDSDQPEPAFTTLLSFYTPGCGPQYFMRFKLHHVPGQNPILAFGNAANKIFFWDLARLRGFYGYVKALTDKADGDGDSGSGGRDTGTANGRKQTTGGGGSSSRSGQNVASINGSAASASNGGNKGIGSRNEVGIGVANSTETSTPEQEAPVKRPPWLAPIVHRNRGDGKPRTEPTVRERKAAEKRQATDTELVGPLCDMYSRETLQAWDEKYNIGDPLTPLKAHKVETIQSSTTFVTRQVAWSPGGEWCVVVGSSNLNFVLQRWGRGRKGANVNAAGGGGGSGKQAGTGSADVEG